MPKNSYNWALIGTGSIVPQFLLGLRASAGARAYAVLSRTQQRAEAFAAEHGLEKAYSDSAALLADDKVDVVYIASPHPLHKQQALAALRAGKAVLCEKPVTINAAGLQEIVDCARETGSFFMEAMWTRFFPALQKAKRWIADGLIGDVKMLQASYGFVAPWLPEARLLNPLLGGGALLDVGVYPISLASFVFGGAAPQQVSGLLSLGKTGVDEQFSAVLSYRGGKLATVSAAIRTALQNDAWIYGTEGRIHLPDFLFGRSATLHVEGKYQRHYEPEVLANGYNYEVDEVTRCLQAGLAESHQMPLAESLQIMQVMDAIRAQNQFRYPGED